MNETSFLFSHRCGVVSKCRTIRSLFRSLSSFTFIRALSIIHHYCNNKVIQTSVFCDSNHWRKKESFRTVRRMNAKWIPLAKVDDAIYGNHRPWRETNTRRSVAENTQSRSANWCRCFTRFDTIGLTNKSKLARHLHLFRRMMSFFVVHANVSTACGSLVVNHRHWNKDLTDKHVGNYLDLLVMNPADYSSPTYIRSIVSSSGSASPWNLPGSGALQGTVSCWHTLNKDLQPAQCERLTHLPLRGGMFCLYC